MPGWAFIVTAFNKLLEDENFCTLLSAEALSTMPKYFVGQTFTQPNKQHE